VAEPPATVTLTIDGRAVTVARGTTVWHAAQQAGIDIPIFCYLDRMPPLGACRQCFVRVEKMPRLQTSCTLVAEEGMVVSASTPDVRAAQERNLEFLLINHPLDCPICDKGGECPLQDQTFAYGPGRSATSPSRSRWDRCWCWTASAAFSAGAACGSARSSPAMMR